MSGPDDEPRPIRVFVFPARTDVLLIYAPSHQSFWLPRIAAPFERSSVAKLLGDHDISAVVRDSVPGRFTQTVQKAIDADKAARRIEDHRRQAAHRVRVQLDPDASTHEKQRVALVARLDDLKSRLRDLQQQIEEISRDDALHKRPSASDALRAKRVEIRKLADDRAAIEAKLREIRIAEKAANKAKSSDRERRFIELVRGALTEVEWTRLWTEAAAETADESSTADVPSASDDSPADQ